eukprot:3136139-Rhodomonas_salina.2
MSCSAAYLPRYTRISRSSAEFESDSTRSAISYALCGTDVAVGGTGRAFDGTEGASGGTRGVVPDTDVWYRWSISWYQRKCTRHGCVVLTASVVVPEEMYQFELTVKRKEHSMYG